MNIGKLVISLHRAGVGSYQAREVSADKLVDSSEEPMRRLSDREWALNQARIIWERQVEDSEFVDVEA